MPNIKSAIKRVKVTEKKNLRNRMVRSAMKTIVKKYETAVAAGSAALAEYLGSDISGFRIHSIKRVGGAEEIPEEQRRELIAAISAAIAEDMGEDVSAIRIHSIKKVA